MKNFCHAFFFIYRGGTIHVLWAMVQRSGHSTCGYHGWSPWRTCCLFCSCGKGLSREPQQQNFGFTRLSQPEIFFGVVFQPICMVFLQSWPKATLRTLQWLFSIFGTYLEASLVAIVFPEYLPLFVFSFFSYCFPVKFAREGIQFQTDQLYIHSCLVCVCVWICIETGRSLMTSPFLVPLKNLFHIQ